MYLYIVAPFNAYCYAVKLLHHVTMYVKIAVLSELFKFAVCKFITCMCANYSETQLRKTRLRKFPP
jgi:hypothetical protein